MLAGAGGVAGLAFGQLAGSVLRSIFLPGETTLRVASDPRTMALVAIVTLIAGVAIGLVPIIAAGRDDLATTLKAGAREGTYQRSRARSGLLILQSTLSVLLLIGAGLFVRSLHNVRSIRLGYDVDHLIYVSRHLRGARMDGPAQAAQVDELIARARAIPGVTGASRAVTVPMSNSWSMPVIIPSLDTSRRRGVQLQAQWTYTGYDASAHVAEETLMARKNCAWGVFLSVAVSAVVGYILLLALTWCIPRGDIAATANDPYPVLYVAYENLRAVFAHAQPRGCAR